MASFTCPHCGAEVRADRFPKHVEQRCEKRPMPHPFADVLPRRDIPGWLAALSDSTQLPIPIPLKDVLGDSCFYPASGLDASPIIIANGFVHSFVFVDYGIKREDYLRELREVGFRGYGLLFDRNIEKNEIVPDDWISSKPMSFDEPNGYNRLIAAQRDCAPFAHWSIWRRRESYDDRIGPPIFSLFFLAGEGVAAFQYLYALSGIVPAICAIIQPGHAFGNNWTNFFRAEGLFWKSVEAGAAVPEHILIGTYGDGRTDERKSPFDGYTFLRRVKMEEPDRDEYIYNEQGDKTRFFRVASRRSKNSGFELRKERKRGMAHTIDIFRRCHRA